MKWVKLIFAILISQLAGIIGSLFTITSTNSWYTTIIKPSFNPPNWIFGPVWTLLYLLMGISLYLILTTKKSKNRKIGLYLFFTQLVLNTLWSILFFGLHSPLAAFIEIILLWISILLTIKYFYKVNKKASYLLIPYILWVTFAAILNLSIVIIN
ncbi:TspO protein [Candidatus Pacearchaeota archaeon CG_4_9_14_0_2_um_filter_30_8]|nr:MAG: TspO protein [Candidatus Pacearchaeota archaeon CG_4_9_14_0_2_um_filter_30_8]